MLKSDSILLALRSEVSNHSQTISEPVCPSQTPRRCLKSSNQRLHEEPEHSNRTDEPIGLIKSLTASILAIPTIPTSKPPRKDLPNVLESPITAIAAFHCSPWIMSYHGFLQISYPRTPTAQSRHVLLPTRSSVGCKWVRMWQGIGGL